MVESSNTEWNF